MAVTTYGINDTLTIKTWGRTLMVEALRATPIAPLMGRSDNNIIQIKTEPKESGDKVTFGLRVQLTGDGVTEGELQQGNEEALSTYATEVLINELMHAVKVRNKNTIDQQRVPFNLREHGKDGLRDWWARRWSVSFFNQVCGYTPQVNVKYSGLNSIVGPGSQRQVFAGTGATSDQTLDSADKFSLLAIDYAKELAQTTTETGGPIRPLTINGEEKYCTYLHPYQVTDLRTDAQATAGSWFDIQKAALQGGRQSDNPIYTGALGEHNGVILRQSYDVTLGVHSSNGTSVANVRRAPFMGAQAAVLAFGKLTDSPTSFNWVEQLEDYERQLGISAQQIFGLKKTTFNNDDFAVIIISSWAVAHA